MDGAETGDAGRSRAWKRVLTGLGVAVLMALVAATVVSLIVDGRGEIARRSPQANGPGVRAEIQARDFAFLPEAVEAEAGRPLILTLSGVGLSEHTFTVQELNVDVVLSPGETKAITVRPEGTEKVHFFCRYHQAGGMQGFIQVA